MAPPSMSGKYNQPEAQQAITALILTVENKHDDEHKHPNVELPEEYFFLLLSSLIWFELRVRIECIDLICCI